MSKLWIVGDSFSYHYRDESYLNDERTKNAPIWPRLLAERLPILHLINYSQFGVSQEWIFDQIKKNILSKISPEDFLVVVLTEPSRYWYIEDQPSFSNFSMSLGLGTNALKILKNERLQTAIELFMTEISRDVSALRNQEFRLGWLAEKIKSMGLRKPLLLQGWNTIKYNEWQDLSISEGGLTEIQGKEAVIDAIELKWWNNLDLRYNHLCLSNHAILSKQITDFFLKGIEVNFSLGEYRDRIINSNSVRNQNFVRKELNPIMVDNFLNE